LTDTVEAPKFEIWPLLKQITKDYWEEGRNAHEAGRLVAWCSGVSPSDYLSAMDFFIAFPMNQSATTGAMGQSVEMCEVAEARGYPDDLCSYARTNIGTALSSQDLIGSLPRPDLLLVCNNQCITIAKWWENLSRLLDVPMILIDVPYLHDDFGKEDIDRVIDYVGQQLRELPAQIEHLTGRRFDHDRLAECVRHTGAGVRAWREGLRKRSNVPSPMTVFDVYNLLFPALSLRGRPEAADFYGQLNLELAERVANNVAAVPGEKYRLHFDAPPPWFAIRQLSSRFASEGAAVITGAYPLSFLPLAELDGARPVESIAGALATQYVNWGVGRRNEILIELLQEYQLDGMVMQWAQTCKPCSIGQYDQIDAVREKLKLPSMVIDGDMCDARLYSDTETDARIEAFIETLAKASM
jgi:benzoyl-CoA reductase/2-hydroxyglutaryl-CoA dehydratase subunit BcrC/BadD/HgdB